MMKNYAFKIEGSSANGQTWMASGVMECEFHETFNAAMKHTFQQLTNGEAVYGKPGVGCNGPYNILRVLIEQEIH
jgi:hypothetical protein